MLQFVSSIIPSKGDQTSAPLADAETFHYETVHIDQMEYDQHMNLFRYPCPCGDLFEINVDDLLAGERVAECPTCSLTILIDDEKPVSAYVAERVAACS
ncbi:Zinc finger DPH-type [Perkinsela sp. CCAP 1560/4]|nr:Zinc finger DPH-type [Perkinsela sp. CCAP 1560/4]|eukprot:KNH03650.1 Zinc finger DPH-type [Perkinsela sp. CCAP 1560/4]